MERFRLAAADMGLALALSLGALGPWMPADVGGGAVAGEAAHDASGDAGRDGNAKPAATATPTRNKRKGKKGKAAEKPFTAPGPAIGETIPTFQALDQDGKARTLADVTGTRGALFIFHRSAGW